MNYRSWSPVLVSRRHRCWWMNFAFANRPARTCQDYLLVKGSFMKQLRVTDGFILTSPKIIVSNVSPQWNLRLPEKTQCFVQILTLKPHPWCSSSNAICQQWLANHNQNRKTTGEQVPFEKPWRSHSTAICTDWLAQHNRIATHANPYHHMRFIIIYYYYH